MNNSRKFSVILADVTSLLNAASFSRKSNINKSTLSLIKNEKFEGNKAVYLKRVGESLKTVISELSAYNNEITELSKLSELQESQLKNL